MGYFLRAHGWEETCPPTWASYCWGEERQLFLLNASAGITPKEAYRRLYSIHRRYVNGVVE